MADSAQDGPLVVTIKANGTPIADNIGLIAVETFTQVNQIASAQITLADGDVTQQTFALSEQDTFVPGTQISISAGVLSEQNVIYEGIIIKHSISIGDNNQTMLVLSCKDQALATTIARHSQSFLKQKDSDIIQTLLGNYRGLAVNSVDTTPVKHDELTQFNCSDWDFILTRAEANALIVCNQQNKIAVVAPKLSDSPTLTITYGKDIIDFAAQIDPTHQLKQVSGIGWDIDQQQTTTVKAASQSISHQGNLNATTLASVLGIDDYRLQTAAPLTQESLDSWSKGQQLKSALSRIRGSVTIPGTADATINSLLKLEGLGARFNGSHFISGVHHRIEHSQWTTILDLGLSPMWSTEHRDLGAPSAGGWLPPVDGLQIGVVSKLDEDPLSLSRIQVQVPTLEDDKNLLWARFVSYYATQTSGNFFIPEVGDEVLLGYLNNDPSQPIILGSLYSSQHQPPFELSAENNIKALVSKNQLKIEFNEKDKSITVVTPGGNSIVLSDNDKSIVMTDLNSNSVTLNESGISLKSPKDIQLTATGEITLKATKNINLEATSDLTGKGMNVTLQAQTGLTAKSSATCELSTSGITTIKGGMVKIN